MFEELAKILSPTGLLLVAVVGAGAYAVVRGILDRKKPEMQPYANGGNPGGLGIPSWLVIGPMQEAFSEFYKACENQRNIKEMFDRNLNATAAYQAEDCKLQKHQCENQKDIIELLKLIQDDTRKFAMAQIMHTKLLEDIRNDMLVRPGTPRQGLRKREGVE